MQDKLELVRKTNEMRGVEQPAEISVAFDGRHTANKSLMTGDLR